VRCWFAPHDLPIGHKILDGVDSAIRLRDRVVLILSEHSIGSDWVEVEVTTALEEERMRKTARPISRSPRRRSHDGERGVGSATARPQHRRLPQLEGCLRLTF
jgi:TIR domain